MVHHADRTICHSCNRSFNGCFRSTKSVQHAVHKDVSTSATCQCCITFVLYFAFILFVILLALSLSFYVYHFADTNYHNKSNDTLVSAEPCEKENSDEAKFSTFAHSLYETVLISAGIMVPQSIYFTQSEAPSLAVALYVLSLLILYIVLLNLMLALINKRIMDIDEHKESIMIIQKLSIYLFIANNKIFKPRPGQTGFISNCTPNDKCECECGCEFECGCGCVSGEREQE